MTYIKSRRVFRREIYLPRDFHSEAANILASEVLTPIAGHRDLSARGHEPGTDQLFEITAPLPLGAFLGKITSKELPFPYSELM
jgi:hypothetical protein